MGSVAFPAQQGLIQINLAVVPKNEKQLLTNIVQSLSEEEIGFVSGSQKPATALQGFNERGCKVPTFCLCKLFPRWRHIQQVACHLTSVLKEKSN